MEDQNKQQLEYESGKKGKAKPEQGAPFSRINGIGSMNKKPCMSFPGFGQFEGMLEEVLADNYVVEATHDGKVQQGVLAGSGSSSKIQEELLTPMNGKSTFSTPPHKTNSGRNLVDVGLSIDAEEIEAPDAPKQLRASNPRLSKKKLAKLSVALFASGDEEAALKEIRSPK